VSEKYKVESNKYETQSENKKQKTGNRDQNTILPLLVQNTFSQDYSNNK
jgi:hypothetical protein